MDLSLCLSLRCFVSIVRQDALRVDSRLDRHPLSPPSRSTKFVPWKHAARIRKTGTYIYIYIANPEKGCCKEAFEWWDCQPKGKVTLGDTNVAGSLGKAGADRRRENPCSARFRPPSAEEDAVDTVDSGSNTCGNSFPSRRRKVIYGQVGKARKSRHPCVIISIKRVNVSVHGVVEHCRDPENSTTYPPPPPPRASTSHHAMTNIRISG